MNRTERITAKIIEDLVLEGVLLLVSTAGKLFVRLVLRL